MDNISTKQERIEELIHSIKKQHQQETALQIAKLLQTIKKQDQQEVFSFNRLLNIRTISEYL